MQLIKVWGKVEKHVLFGGSIVVKIKGYSFMLKTQAI